MFKQRLITGLILAPLVLLSIYYSNLWVFTTVAVLLLVACGVEWQQLIPVTELKAQVTFFSCLLIAMALIHFMFNYWLELGLFIWILIFLALYTFPRSQQIWGYPLVVAMISFLLLPLFAQSLINIYQTNAGKSFVVYLMFLIWGADIGAYFTGKFCGRHKLIPTVSPGKTIEGVVGGGVLSMIVALSAYPYFQSNQAIPQEHPLLAWLVLAFFVFVMALIGDLFISMLKRRVQLKDTGTLFPGHGGFLDRLDSFIAGTPAFYFGLLWISGVARTLPAN